MDDIKNMSIESLNNTAQTDPINTTKVEPYEYGGTPDGTALVEENERKVVEATEKLQAENAEMLEIKKEESFGQKIKNLLTSKKFLVGAGTATVALGIILSQSGCSGVPVSSVALAPESYMATSVAATLQSNENVMPIEEATATPTIQPTEVQEATPEYVSIPDKSWNENVRAYIKQVWGGDPSENVDSERKQDNDFVYKVVTDKGEIHLSASFIADDTAFSMLNEYGEILGEVKDGDIFNVIFKALGYLGRDSIVYVRTENGETCYYEKEGLYFVVYYDFEDKPFRADPYVNTIPTSLDPKIQKEFLDGNMLVKVHQDGRVEGSCKGELFSYEGDDSSAE